MQTETTTAEPSAAESDPTPSFTTVLQNHTSALETLTTAVTSRLSTDQPTDAIASHLHTLAQQHSQDTKELLERALSKATVDVLKRAIQDPAHSTSAFHDALPLVDLAISLVRMQHVEDTLPCKLLEYFFSFCTRAQLSSCIDAIRDRFALYRTVVTSKTPVFIIKAVMSYINRDHKGSDAPLSGRLRLMLAASLPVWHPSGMNRRGQINQSEDIDLESVLNESKYPGLDVALYKAFWNVQKFMSNPTLAEIPTGWEKARVDMDTVLSAFETLECPSTAPVLNQCVNPRYMTSPSILRLQMVDISVRRHVLLQFAIFLHHLQAVGETPRTEKDRGAAIMKFSFCKSLFEAEGEGEQMRVRVFKLLEKDSAGKFRKFVSSILQRERRWIEWKKRLGFKHLGESGREAPKTLKRRLVLAPLPGTAGSTPKARKLTGETPEWVTRQSSWKVPPHSGRMAALIEKDRNPVPTVDVLKEQLKEDMNDPDVTDDFKRKNDTKFAWRSLRMLCDESISTLAQVIDPASKCGYDLERCVKENLAPQDSTKVEKVEAVEAK